jgi:hypothetical protein
MIVFLIVYMITNALLFGLISLFNNPVQNIRYLFYGIVIVLLEFFQNDPPPPNDTPE